MDKKLRQLQLRLLDGLDYIDRICTNNNLQYYLIGGTLLGAVRHRGFIPWDSDIDIALTRENYHKLVKILKNNAECKYYLLSYEDPDSPVAFSRLLFKNTVYIKKKCKHEIKYKEIYIDIFPLDYINKYNKIQNKIVEKMLYLLQRLKSYRIGYSDSDSYKSALLLRILNFLILIDNKRITEVINAIITFNSSRRTKYVTNYYSHYGCLKEIQRIEDFEQTVLLEFENKLFLAPRNYDRVLRNVYGDYMKLPDKKHRPAYNWEQYDLTI